VVEADPETPPGAPPPAAPSMTDHVRFRAEPSASSPPPPRNEFITCRSMNGVNSLSHIWFAFVSEFWRPAKQARAKAAYAVKRRCSDHQVSSSGAISDSDF